MADFYHIFIKPKKDVSSAQVDEKMNLAIDWFRCTQNVWIVYTTSDHKKWKVRLKPLVDPDGSLFICRLDIKNYDGWMTRKFWDWIKDKSSKT